jgi:transcriptional regulator with XRE-family HTH domain
MNDFTKPLADSIRQARANLGLTQEQVAELANTDPMNIMKMENTNRNANPELATLYPVIRALNIDPQEIFYPEISRDNPRIRLLQQLISDCSDAEADALIPIIRELIQFMRSGGKTHIEE